GQKVFACPLPEKLLWLERRRYYRVKAPLEHPPRCLIRIENETSEFSILDISMSGLAVITENTGFESRIDTGLILDDCKIVFPEYGEGIATLEIRNKTPGHKISLKDHVRFGCAFRQVLPAFESTIQRYMQMIERKRKNAP
ncbi:MAG: PilZ domain-containing protein, partial [Pseudomonadota bacterium]